MASTYTGNFHSIHSVESSKVARMVREIQSSGGYNFDPIEVRKVDGMNVIVDGVHRATAACITNVPAKYEIVEENELLTDDDIRRKSLYLISNLASDCGV